METRILLLRHGETSAPDLFHGAESDVGLGDRGRRQAEEVAASLATARPTAVVSSGMRRALETAAPIAAACGREVEVIAALHERRMGHLSGRPKEGPAWEQYEAEARRWMAGDLDATHPGAESYREVQGRVLPVFLDLAGRHRGETIVVVCHGLVIRVVLTSLVDGLGPADFLRVAIDFVKVNDLRPGTRWAWSPGWPGREDSR